MVSRDEVVGRSLRELRESRQMTQAELAAELRRRGLTGFYPQTILKVEKGQRALKLTEGAVIAEVLDATLDAIAGDAAAVSEGEKVVRGFIGMVAGSHENVLNAAEHLAVRRDILEDVLRERDDVPSALREASEAVLSKTAPEVLVERVRETMRAAVRERKGRR